MLLLYVMKKTHLIILFILFGMNASSQEEVVLKGKLLIDSVQGSNIHIVNLTKKTGTVTNSSGHFSLPVRQNDTLLFTSVQYIKKEIVIDEEIFRNPYLEIVLTEELNELEEVNISNISLSGNLSRDISELKTFNKYDLGVKLNTRTLPTPEERRLYTATHAAGGILSVDMLINTLSGRLKRLKNEKEIADLTQLVKNGMLSLPETFFTENLNLPEEDVVNFLYYCAENSNLNAWLKDENDLQLMEYFERMAKEYKNFKMDQ